MPQLSLFTRPPTVGFSLQSFLYAEKNLLHAHAYGWTVVAFRYFNACGATATVGEDHDPETHIIPLLLQTAVGERPSFEIYGSDYPTPDGTCLRDYVHVLDIAEAHLLALQIQQNPSFLAYNIGTGTSFSVTQICQEVEEELGVKIALRIGPRRQAIHRSFVRTLRDS
jgi:UDP-glucose 4-epimerase